MQESPEISVVIPAYDEAESLPDCVREVRGILGRIGRRFEIIVVDDGSRDATFGVLRGMKGEAPELRAIRLGRHSGQTAAMAAGFRAARAPIVITMDADGQNDPADIPAILEGLKIWDAVCGVRVRRADSWLKRVSSRIANGIRNLLTGERWRDVGCSLKGYRRGFLGALPLFDGMHRFLPTLLTLAGARVTEVPVNHRPRRRGRSKYNIRNRLFVSLRDLFAVRWMRRRWLRYEVAETLD